MLAKRAWPAHAIPSEASSAQMDRRCRARSLRAWRLWTCGCSVCPRRPLWTLLPWLSGSASRHGTLLLVSRRAPCAACYAMLNLVNLGLDRQLHEMRQEYTRGGVLVRRGGGETVETNEGEAGMRYRADRCVLAWTGPEKRLARMEKQNGCAREGGMADCANIRAEERNARMLRGGRKVEWWRG